MRGTLLGRSAAAAPIPDPATIYLLDGFNRGDQSPFGTPDRGPEDWYAQAHFASGGGVVTDGVVGGKGEIGVAFPSGGGSGNDEIIVAAELVAAGITSHEFQLRFTLGLLDSPPGSGGWNHLGEIMVGTAPSAASMAGDNGWINTAGKYFGGSIGLGSGNGRSTALVSDSLLPVDGTMGIGGGVAWADVGPGLFIYDTSELRGTSIAYTPWTGWIVMAGGGLAVPVGPVAMMLYDNANTGAASSFFTTLDSIALANPGAGIPASLLA